MTRIFCHNADDSFAYRKYPFLTHVWFQQKKQKVDIGYGIEVDENSVLITEGNDTSNV